ncbi:MAG: V-type ATP synthase subunit D [Candidatus Omnitrophota bacterium]
MKVKLTKGELKKQRDALRQFLRYLPTLQLKKQQLQLEILQQQNLLEEKKRQETKKKEAVKIWAGLIPESQEGLARWLVPQAVVTQTKNVAGVDLAVYKQTDFTEAEYDLFTTPLWVDFALEALRNLVSLENEIEVLQKASNVLKHELRITTQRVNLFEKIKIPETSEAIHLIKIYIGDQMANAVGRSKIAKRKIEAMVFEGAVV